MKRSLHRRVLAVVLLLAIVFAMLPVSAIALEASTVVVAWEYNDKTAEKVDVPATTGTGYLSHSSGDALAANSTGYFSHNKWNTPNSYWQLSGIDTSGKSHLVLELRVQGSATGPKNWNVIYSTDAGDNWQTAGSYSIANASTTEKPSIEFPEDAISENLIIRLTPADSVPISSAYTTVGGNGTNKISFIRLYVMESGYQTLAAFHFTVDDHPDTFPTPATEGWGYLNTTASGEVKLVSEKDEKLMAMSVKKWGVGHNWCMVFNTTDCTDLVLEADVLSSGTGPADWAVEYSADLGENWTWVQSYHLANSTTKLQHQTIHLPAEAQSANLLVRFRVDSDTALNGGSINKTQCTSRINHVTLTGLPGENHTANPAAPTWPDGYGDTASDAIPSDAFVGWNFEEAKSLPAGAVKGWGWLANSITTGPAYTGGGLAIKGWEVGACWLLIANTTGYSGMKLTAKLGSSSTGPRDFALEYSTNNGATWTRAGGEIRLTSALENYTFTVPDDAQAANCMFRLIVTSNQSVKATDATPATIASGGNSKINMVYMTGSMSGTHTADPAVPTYPADFKPAQEDIDEGFINADVVGDPIAAWKFEDASILPANATTGWGTLSHITSAYCSYVSKALSQTGWTTGSYWQVVANTSGCTSMTFQLRTGSSSTGPKNLSLRYSTDLGETWVEFAQLTITGSLKNYIVDLPDAAESTNLVIRVVVADDESIKGDVIKNGGSNKINNVAIFGLTGAGHQSDPAEAQYPADWRWPQTYNADDVFVPNNDASAGVTDFTYNEDDRRVIASWGGNANYAGDLKVYGDLITANDRMDGQAVMTVNVGGTDITPGFSTSSTNSTNYYLGSKSPCMGSGMTTVDENGDGVPDTEVDEDGNTVEILIPTEDYLQMKVSTAKYTKLGLSFRLRVSNAGPSGFTARYSTDGEDWINFGSGHYSYAYTGYGYGGATYDVSGEGDIVGGFIPMDVGGSYVSVELNVPKGCENAETLYIRLYASRIRQTPTVNAAGETVTAVSKISSVRIDTVELTGCPMIHPQISDWVRSDLPSSVPAGQQLVLHCGTDDATIYYSLDCGRTVLTYDPNDPPVLDTFPALVKVWSDSPHTEYDSVKTYYYFAQAQVTPVKAKPNGGAVPVGTEIKFTCATEGAVIRYSFDGGENWDVYDPAHKPVLTEALLENDCTVMVMGTKEGYVNSPISVLTFTRRLNEYYNLYFGQLHSHTNLSDGAGSCEEAFYHAANEVDHLDFLAVTDHSNAFDNDLAASVHDGSMSSKWVYGHELADKYTREDFVGLYGYEMTWSNGLGHINTYNTAGFQSRTQTEFASYATALSNYYAALKSDANSLSQFNHPGTTFGTFEDYAYYDEVIDELITIIEVGNGEGTIGSSGYFPSYQEYTRALDLGWHVAPTNNQDNHKGHWGDSNTARTVVMADSLTRNNIYDAIRNRRVYATEDYDFSIYYTLDNYEMGTILSSEDVEDTVRLKAVISDPTDTGSVKVDVMVNGGIVAATKSVPVRESTVEFDLSASYSYYYLRLTQADGNIAVTAPVWIGEVEAIGIKDVTTDADIPIQNEQMQITLNLYNDEDLDLTIDSIVFTVGGQTVHTVDLAANGLTALAAHSTASYTFPFTYGGIGTMILNATVNGVYNGVDKQYNGVLQMEFLPDAMISNVIIDGTHYNDYVTGNYSGNVTKVVQLGADNFARVRVETGRITKDMLDDCRLLIITSPAKRSMSGYYTSHFEDSFVSMVADFVAGGGSVVLCGSADFNDSTACQTHTEMNKLLAAIGSTVRLRSDEVGELRDNGTVNYAPELKNFDITSKWMAGARADMGFEVYSACSVNIGNNAETTAVYPAQKLVWGNAETFSLDTKTDAGVSVNSEELLYVQQPGDVIETVVQDTKAGGHIFVSGGVFLSDFNMETDENELKLNGVLMQNILAGTGAPLPVTPIADMRQGSMGEVFCIEGWVTNGTANDKTKFFDTIYVQDETGGVTVYPYSVEGLQIGTKVRIVGYKDAYQDDIEIQVLRCTILDGENLNVIEPKSVKCEDAMNYHKNGGQLLKTQGVIIEALYLGDAVTQLRLKDETGVAMVFIDGYIYSGTTGRNDLADFCTEGAVVSAVGLCFMHPEAGSDVSTCCLRVRDCDEVVLIAEECEHDFTETVTAPTCTAGGYTTYTCAICGYSYVGSEIDPLGHLWDDGVVTVEPTTSTSGVRTFTCTRCGATKTEPIPPIEEPPCAHDNPYTEHKEPTCLDAGYDRVICDDCGELLSETVLPALGHAWNAGVVTVGPTATEPGVKTFTCTRCGATKTEEIPPTGEQPCTHEDTYPEHKEPTCTEAGYDRLICDLCGELLSETILPALGHDWRTIVTPPTCTEQGYTTHICSRCGASYVDSYTDALGYDWMVKDGAFKVLLIGNSYSEDAANCGQGMTTSRLYSMLKNAWPDKEIVVGLLYSGGKTMAWHYDKALRGVAAESLRVVDDDHTEWYTVAETITAADALEWTDWDVVTLQPYGNEIITGVGGSHATDETSYSYSLEESFGYFLHLIGQTAPSAQVYLYAHWSSATSAALNVSAEAFLKTIPTLMETTYTGKLRETPGQGAYTETGERFAGVIPGGTAIQNARNTYLGCIQYHVGVTPINTSTDPVNGLLRDNGHVAMNQGRYLLALTFALSMTNRDADTLCAGVPLAYPGTPVGTLPADYLRIVKASAINAVAHPTVITDASLDDDIDPAIRARDLLERSAENLTVCAADDAAPALNGKINEQLAGLRKTWPELSAEVNGVSVGEDGAYTATVTLCFGYTTATASLRGSAVLSGHDWNAPTYVWAADNSSVTASRDCRNDASHVETETVTTVVRTVEAGCTAAGETTYTATFNNPAFATQTRTVAIDPLGHVPGTPAKENEVYPTCTAAGGYDLVTRCTVCGEELSRAHTEVPAFGHDLVDHAAKAPTCTEVGWNAWQECRRCDYSTYAEMPALGHSWDEGKVTTPATATTDGVKTFTCTRCGATRTETIPATGELPCAHEHARPERKEPTCLDAGYERMICDDCGEVLSETILPALGHDLVDHAAKAPTCLASGWNAYQTCSRCDYTTYAAIAALGHEWDEGKVTTPATKANDPVYTFTCLRCGETKTETVPCPSRQFKDLDPTLWYHEGTDFAIANGLMNGVGDRIFDPNGTLNRAMLVTILYRWEGSPSVRGLTNPFKDVPAGQWYTDAVIWAADNGIVKGMSPTSFAPTAAITREQIAAILYRYAGSEAVTGSLSKYPDANKVSGYAVDAMLWAVHEGVINGTLEHGVVILDPTGNATRAQCATMLSRFLTKE